MERINYHKKLVVDPDLKEKHYFQVLGDEMMLWFPEKDTPMIWATWDVKDFVHLFSLISLGSKWW